MPAGRWWEAVRREVAPLLRPKLQRYDALVISVSGGKAKVAVLDEPTDPAENGRPHYPVVGAAPVVGARVLFLADAFGGVVVTGGGGSGGGVTDHGALTGLSDDDHPQYALDTDLAAHTGAPDPHTQYHTDARGDARYKQLANERIAEQAATVAATSYPLGVSIMEVLTAVGWPTTTGLVKTFRYSDGNTVQEFIPKNTSTMWLRWWGASSWSSFVEVNSALYARLGHAHTDMTQIGTGTPAAGKYLDGSGAWTTLPAGSGGAANPITDPEWFDDFLAGGTATGDIGAMGWEFQGGNAVQRAGESGRPGIFGRTTGATANVVTALNLRGVAAFLPAAAFDMTFSARVIATNFGLSNLAFRMGLLDTTNTAPANGIFLDYVSGEAGAVGLVTRAAGVQTKTAGVFTLAADAWFKVRIRRVDATTIGFTVNNGSEILHTTNIPTVGLFPNLQFTNGTAVNRGFDVDYWHLKIAGLAR